MIFCEGYIDCLYNSKVNVIIDLDHQNKMIKAIYLEGERCFVVNVNSGAMNLDVLFNFSINGEKSIVVFWNSGEAYGEPEVVVLEKMGLNFVKSII